MVNHDRGIFKLLLTIDGVADRIAFLIALKAPPLSHFYIVETISVEPFR